VFFSYLNLAYFELCRLIGSFIVMPRFFKVAFTGDVFFVNLFVDAALFDLILLSCKSCNIARVSLNFDPYIFTINSLFFEDIDLNYDLAYYN